MSDVETFGAPTLADVQFNDDGSLKQSGKQNIKFYHKTRLSFRGKVKRTAEDLPMLDEDGKQIPIIDPKTGIPFKEAFEETILMVRIETKGDTNIVDDIASDLHKRQFYRQYKHFSEGKIPEGNPIEDFDFFQSPAIIMELHMLGIHVIQQVATMNDIECQQLKDQSGYELRDIASQWVRINSPAGLASKTTQQDLKIARLERELAEAKRNARGGAPAQRAVESTQPVSPPMQTMEIDPKNRPRKV